MSKKFEKIKPKEKRPFEDIQMEGGPSEIIKAMLGALSPTYLILKKLKKLKESKKLSDLDLERELEKILGPDWRKKKEFNKKKRKILKKNHQS